MLRRLRLFPVCGRKREWPCCQFSDMVLISRRPGDDAWRFRESCPDVLRAGSNPSHVWSEKRARVQWMNAATPRGGCGRFVRFGRSRGQHKRNASAKRRCPVHYCVRSVRAPLFRELPPKHVNWRRSLPARVRRGRAFARHRPKSRFGSHMKVETRSCSEGSGALASSPSGRSIRLEVANEKRTW
jgi:hypothetical protein